MSLRIKTAVEKVKVIRYRVRLLLLSIYTVTTALTERTRELVNINNEHRKSNAVHARLSAQLNTKEKRYVLLTKTSVVDV